MIKSELSATEQRMWQAFSQGTLVDLRAGSAHADDLTAANEWGADRTVRGAVIAELLLGACASKRGHVPRVRLAGARVEGAIDVSEGQVLASLSLLHCRLDSPPDFTGVASRSVKLASCALPGFHGRLLRADGDVIFDSCLIDGRLELRHAYIQGSLHVDGCALACPGRQALSAGGITVEGGTFARHHFRLEGNIRLVGGTFNGGLFFEGAHLHNPQGDTLTGDRIVVRGPVECSGAFYSVGTVSLRGSQIGSLSLDGATLECPGDYALHADHLQVATYLSGTAGFTAQGEVCLNDAHIGTVADFTGARLHNPGGSSLTALGINVEAIMNCCDGFDSSGKIELRHGRVGQILRFHQAHLSNPGGLALWAEQLEVKDLFLEPADVEGAIDLRHARIGILHDNPAAWPRMLRLDGLVYEILHPQLSAHDRLRWLRRDIDGYVPRAYEQLGRMYRRFGHAEDARTVLLAKQRRRRRSLSPLPKVWGYVQDCTVGYGYRPVRAGLGLVLLWTIGAIVFSLHHPPPAAGVDPQSFQPVVYALGLMLPIIDFQEENTFTPHGAQSWLAFGLICAGWILTTAVAAGITRALRGERD